MNKIGLQQYTVRESLQRDVENTLTKVKKIGYESIQLAGSIELVKKTVRENFENIYFMLDTYWIQYGGADIRKTIEDFKGRVKILHLKDMERVHEGQTTAPLGCGNLYFEGIIKTAKECGIENFCVEQDVCAEAPLICIEKSYNYIKELI